MEVVSSVVLAGETGIFGFLSDESVGMDADEDDVKLVDEIARLTQELPLDGSFDVVCTPFSSNEAVEGDSSRLFNDWPVMVHADILLEDMSKLKLAFFGDVGCLQS